VKARKVKKLDPEGTLVENTGRIIRTRIDELRSFAPEALKESGTVEQHDMRIAAKRLRYVLEATGFCFGRPAERARHSARDLQDVLGELHDCEVMLPQVSEHAAELRTQDAASVRQRAGVAPDLDPKLVVRAPNRGAYRGLELLAVHFQARRALLFDRFVELWGELERERTWKKLEQAIDRKLA
jgi:CHAD domain